MVTSNEMCGPNPETIWYPKFIFFFLCTWKKNKEESKVTLLLDRLNDPMTNVYTLFLHIVLPIIDSFTGLLECEEPMIHKFGECINT